MKLKQQLLFDQDQYDTMVKDAIDDWEKFLRITKHHTITGKPISGPSTDKKVSPFKSKHKRK